MTNQMNFFITRTQNHISTVDYYAGLLNLNFTNHDASKFLYPEKDAYALLTWSKANPGVVVLTNQEKYRIRKAIKHHYIRNGHHPESFEVIAQMQDLSITEMVCDWYAMSAEQQFGNNDGIEFGNTMNFYREKALPKYNFTERQQNLIVNIFQIFEHKQNLMNIEKIWAR